MIRQIYFLILLFFNLTVFAKTPMLFLDSGHMPYPEDKKGALGIRGIYEVEYNDKFVGELKAKIEKIGWQVILSRTPNEYIGLKERAKKANDLGVDLFLSIHHDSAYPHYLEKIPAQKANGENYFIQTLTEKDISGYSIFISHKNPQKELAHCFASLLGKNILALGRNPNLIYHQDKDSKRLLLDEKYGIYHFDNLAVLRLTQMPSVLLEIGVIVNENDITRWIEDDINRAKMEDAIVKALAQWDKCIK